MTRKRKSTKPSASTIALQRRLSAADSAGYSKGYDAGLNVGRASGHITGSQEGHAMALEEHRTAKERLLVQLMEKMAHLADAFSKVIQSMNGHL